MTATYTTLSDLIEREITPALFDGTESVEPNFDIDGFVAVLRERDLIVWDDAGQGFQLVTEDGETPGFWDLVQDFDGAAAERHLVITEDVQHTMAMVNAGPLNIVDVDDLDDDAYEVVQAAQEAGEDDYYQRWAEAATAEALKLGYTVTLHRASVGSQLAAEQTCTSADEYGDNSIEARVWQSAHDATPLPEGWDR